MKIKELKVSLKITFENTDVNPSEYQFKQYVIKSCRIENCKIVWKNANTIYIYPNGCEYWEDVKEDIIAVSKIDLNKRPVF